MIELLKKYDPDKVLNRITEIIIDYTNNMEKYDDNHISDMRARLASGAYIFVETNLAPAHEDMVAEQAMFERVEAEVFKKTFDTLVAEGKSPSLASDLARKIYKADPEYIDAVTSYNMAKNVIYLSDKLLAQANQVLNSMGKRNR